MEKLTEDDIKCRCATYRNLIPALRQQEAGLKDKILNLEHDIHVNRRQVNEMAAFLADHGMAAKTMAEWAADMRK